MNWDAIEAIGQMLGSIAVLVTLGYLAVQVRYAREEVRRSISQSRAEGARELLMNRANSDQLSNLYVRANTTLGGPRSSFIMILVEKSGLTVEETLRLVFEQEAWWQYRAQIIPHLDELPAGEKFGFEEAIRRSYGASFDALWYENRKTALDPEAVRYVDNLLAQVT